MLISTAVIPIAADVPTVRPASQGPGDTESMSFAKNFNESMASSGVLAAGGQQPDGKDATVAAKAANEAGTGFGNGKTKQVTGQILTGEGKTKSSAVATRTGHIKNDEEHPGAHAEVKPDSPAHESKGTAAAGKDVATGKINRFDIGPKTMPAKIGAKQGMAAHEDVQEDIAAGDIEKSVAASKGNEVVGQKTQVPDQAATEAVDVAKAASEEADQVPEVQRPVVQGRMTMEDKERTVSEVKESVKGQEAAPVAGDKTKVEKIKQATTSKLEARTSTQVEVQPSISTPAQGSVRSQMPLTATDAKQESDSDEKGNPDARVSLGALPTVGGVIAGKEHAHTPASTAATKSNADDNTTPQAPEDDFKGAIAHALPVGTDGASEKMQGAVAAVEGMVSTHQAVGGIANYMPGMASGQVADNAHVAGLQSQTAAHPTGLWAEPGARDGSGANDTALPPDGMHRTLMTTQTSLEIGISDGDRGWLKIRAEMAGDGVNASLSSTSSTGEKMLHGELPSLVAYLQQEHVAVNAVVVHTPVAAAVTRDAAGMMGGDGHGQGQGQQRADQGGAQSRPDMPRAVNEHEDGGISFERLNRMGDGGALPSMSHMDGRSWLSVRV